MSFGWKNGSPNCHKKEEIEQLRAGGRDAETPHEASKGYEDHVPHRGDMRTKENPADAAAGLSGNSDQADSYTGDDFFEAFCIIVQARTSALDVMRFAGHIIDGHALDSFDDYEFECIRDRLKNAETVYRQMNRGPIRSDFEKILRVDKGQFEAAILLVKRFLGGE